MSTLNVSFKLSEKTRRQELIQHGNMSSEKQTMIFDIEEAFERQRKQLLTYVPLDKFDSEAGITLETYTVDKEACYDNIRSETQILDCPPANIDALLEILSDMATQAATITRSLCTTSQNARPSPSTTPISPVT